jgi:circadian clock protein KaiC
MDPVTDFIAIGGITEVKSMLTRTLDFFKHRGITLLMTALTSGPQAPQETEMHVSSLVDTWIDISMEVKNHNRRRLIRVVKSRGMEHSQEARELRMSSHGLSLGTLRNGEE